jgi:hypothetical protein
MDEFTIIFGFSLIAVNLGMNLYSLINLDKIKKLIKYKIPNSNRILPIKVQKNNFEVNEQEVKVNEQEGEANEQEGEANEQEGEANEQEGEVNEQEGEVNLNEIDLELGVINEQTINNEIMEGVENNNENKGLFSNWFN